MKGDIMAITNINLSEMIKNLSDEDLLEYGKILNDYSKGIKISNTSPTRAWLDSIFAIYPAMDINIVEMKVTQELNVRFGWLVKYLMVKTPTEYICR